MRHRVVEYSQNIHIQNSSKAVVESNFELLKYTNA